ncbi:MAG: phosphate ABC transporter permease PstA [Bacteroidota bacterium]|nr:phosphate ABC transporter permease PstA [Bacteroidota bacterium]
MSSIRRNRLIDNAFRYVGIACTFLGIIVLAIFLADIIIQGVGRIDWDFLTSLPSRRAHRAGILTAWTGTAWILGLTAIIAIPLGICAGIYLEEYGSRNRLAHIIELNIANLAGVPSIIYGLLGLQIFVRTLKMGGSLLAGASTLALLILPIIIVSTREALKAVPGSLREASYGMGATRWQTIWYQVLPAASGGILTGIILALSRAVGETAPLIVIGALAYVPFVAESPMDEFTVLPIQIFNWVSRPQADFVENAAAGIVVLLATLVAMNAGAVVLRARLERRTRW